MTDATTGTNVRFHADFLQHEGQVTCPNCNTSGAKVFYEAQREPVHSVLLLETRDEAINYPRGDIALAFCETCGFVHNAVFDASLHEYSAKYEATQSFSRTFSAFARQQAQDLIEQYGLRGKDVIEIGCGQGEFLTLVCEMGGNRGLGFDPAYRAEPLDSPAADRIEFISDFYGEKYTDRRADLIMCKMTLEHIDKTYDFVRMVRNSVGDKEDTVIFFQVPNAHYVFRDLAFWDIYYEHCSYFSAGSLARVFRACEFDVIDLATVYDDQYITLAARPTTGVTQPRLPLEDDLAIMRQTVSDFVSKCPGRIAYWDDLLTQSRGNGERVVIWGGGSKGVTFLNTLGADEDVLRYAVDINPKKAGMYMAGTGQEIVLPETLKSFDPHTVIVMNPIYVEEIRDDLNKLGLSPQILAL